MALMVAFVLRKTVLSGPSTHFVMELPPYRRPTMKAAWIHTWERGKEFLMRAGTIIFAAVVVIWFLDYVGALEPIGKAIAPVFAPCGFDDWRVSVALVLGITAKEAVVGTFGVLLGATEGGLAEVVGAELAWTPLVAYAFMAFVLLYIPCIATVAVIRRETHSWRWTSFAVVYTIALAWVVATVIYQVGSLFT